MSNGVIAPEAIRSTGTDVHSFPVMVKCGMRVDEVALYLSQTAECPPGVKGRFLGDTV
jgi:hypothetical protein